MTTEENKKWFLYVVECTDEKRSLYCGVTTDVERRVQEHNKSKRGAKYTRARRPVYLFFVEEHGGRSSALKAEAAFKRLDRQQKYAYMARVCEDRLLRQTAEAVGHSAVSKVTSLILDPISDVSGTSDN